MTRLILASTSPYRRELLARLGVPFDVAAPGTDEFRRPGEDPKEMVSRLARDKAAAVARNHEDSLIIGSDQCAVLGGHVLGKPGSFDKAVSQIAAASGHSVRFLTAVCVHEAGSGRIREAVDETIVRFRKLDDAEIRRYVDREQPLDCAGSFKSEGLGITLFEYIENRDPTALMGLPLIALAGLLRDAGLVLP
ncbi:MAG: Maf family nucleotide pyrophosphatase [Proteobacteria bacterium]|nr:Maf family nucleotide pyrophosphatase [Pseudomonadota bacterium]